MNVQWVSHLQNQIEDMRRQLEPFEDYPGRLSAIMCDLDQLKERATKLEGRGAFVK